VFRQGDETMNTTIARLVVTSIFLVVLLPFAGIASVVALLKPTVPWSWFFMVFFILTIIWCVFIAPPIFFNRLIVNNGALTAGSGFYTATIESSDLEPEKIIVSRTTTDQLRLKAKKRGLAFGGFHAGTFIDSEGYEIFIVGGSGAVEIWSYSILDGGHIRRLAVPDELGKSGLLNEFFLNKPGTKQIGHRPP
jgi:hypothetical protein